MSENEIAKDAVNGIIGTLNDLISRKIFGIIDIGDVGNEIGIIVGKFDREQVLDFRSGLEHGISLSDGTHDALPSDAERRRLDRIEQQVLAGIERKRLIKEGWKDK